MAKVELTAGNQADVVIAHSGNDKVYGLNGNDTLDGGSGNDVLDGGLNADKMVGGDGDDTFYVDDPGDRVTEAVGGGTDTVIANLTLALSSTSEIEVLKTSAPAATTVVSLYGNDFAQTITGNAGNGTLSGMGGSDTVIAGAGNSYIYGGLGNDKLTGGLGSDIFVFNTAPNAASNLDHLTDFRNVSGDNDSIRLDNNAFGGFATGALAADYFAANAIAAPNNNTHAQILYNTSTGALYYDSDGSGSRAVRRPRQLCQPHRCSRPQGRRLPDRVINPA